MIGLTYLLFFILYIILWRWVVKRTRAWAKRSNRNPRRWAIAAHLVMYSLVFWDLIPAFSLWGYECGTSGGFTLYKTLDEWKKENPGTAETLKPIANSKWVQDGNVTRVPLNQRFVWEMTDEKYLFGVYGRSERIIDSEAGEVLAEYVDFGTHWFRVSSCDAAFDATRTEFMQLKHSIKYNEELRQ